MKFMPLSMLAAYVVVVSAVPGGDLNHLLDKRDTTKTIESLRLIQINKEVSFTFTSITTIVNVYTLTTTNVDVQYIRSPSKPTPSSITSLWPISSGISSTNKKVSSATFPWPAVDFTDSSRGHGSSPPWAVVTDMTQSSRTAQPSVTLPAEYAVSSEHASWPDVQVTHITRSRGPGFTNVVPGIDYIDITRSRGLYPSPSPGPNFYEANYEELASFWKE